MAESVSMGENESSQATTQQLVHALCSDMRETFPELATVLDSVVALDEKVLGDFMKKTFPPNFFDILYKNDKLFEREAELLPSVDFKFIWERNISDNTRESIWQHLQLILFSIVAEVDDASAFGDAETFFQAVDTDSLRAKLEEVLGNAEKAGPNPQFMEEHLEGLLGGKIGALAKEIASEAARDFSDLGEGLGEEAGVKDVFTRLIEDPMRLMRLIKRIGSRIENEIKSGKLKESELLEEASALLEKMRTTPGMEGLGEMMAKMGVSNQRDIKRTQAQVSEKLKTAKTKERLRNKLAQRRAAREAAESGSVGAESEVLDKSKSTDGQLSTGEGKKKKRKKKRPHKPNAVINDAK